MPLTNSDVDFTFDCLLRVESSIILEWRAFLDLLALGEVEKPDDGALLLTLDGSGQPGQSEEASAKVLKLKLVSSMFQVLHRTCAFF